MSGEQEQPIESATAQEQTSAAFLAGFDDDDNDFQPTATPADVAIEAAPEPTPAPTPAPKYVQITEDDWKSLTTRAAKVDEIGATLEKRFDQAFGKMGGIERKFAEMQAATPQGQTVSIDEADFAELKAEYPELGELTMRALNKTLSKITGTSKADTADIDKIVDKRVAQARAEDRAEMINERLDAVIPKWQEEVKSPAFSTWISSQKGWDTRLNDMEFVKANIDDTNSPLSKWVQANPDEPVALYLSRKVTGAERMLKLYDAARKAKAAKPAPAAAPAAPAQPSIRQRQIAAAVTPRGDRGSAPASSGKSPFQAGFEEDD